LFLKDIIGQKETSAMKCFVVELFAYLIKPKNLSLIFISKKMFIFKVIYGIVLKNTLFINFFLTLPSQQKISCLLLFLIHNDIHYQVSGNAHSSTP
jgi:presenilin-like A22 family membrane protease